MQPPDIDIPIILSTAVMFLMLVAIIIFIMMHQRRVIKFQVELKNLSEEQQNKLTMAAIQSEEAERKRISLELHDEVGALLSAIKLYLHQIQPEHLNNEARIALLNQSKELLDDTVKTVRNLSSNLQPMAIIDFGLESTIQHFCNKINQPGVMEITLTVQDALVRLSPEKDLAVFRIIQELTNNVIKHSGATYLHFSLVQKTDSLDIYIEHNGKGMNQEEYEFKLYHTQGLGLKNIQNRLNVLNGSVYYEKNATLINTIVVKIPVTGQKL